MRIPLHPHHSEGARQFCKSLTGESCYTACLGALPGKSWQNTFPHLTQGIYLSQSIPCHSLSCNRVPHQSHRVTAFNCMDFTYCVYALARTPKQACQIPSMLKAESHQSPSTRTSLRQCTYVTEIPLQLTQALRQAFLYVLKEASDAKIPFCFLK